MSKAKFFVLAAIAALLCGPALADGGNIPTLDSVPINFGVAAAALVVIVVALIGGWRMVTSYVDRQTAEAKKEFEDLKESHEQLKERHDQLQLHLVEKYATNDALSGVVSKIENTLERFANRFDAFANAFNSALVDLARPPRSAPRKTRRR